MKNPAVKNLIYSLTLVVCLAVVGSGQETSEADQTNVGARTKKHLFSSPTTKKTNTESATANSNSAARKSSLGGREKSNSAEPTSVFIAPSQPNPSENVSQGGDSTLPMVIETSEPEVGSANQAMKTTASGGDSILSVGEIANNSQAISSANKIAGAARFEAIKMRLATKPSTEIYRAGVGDVLDIRLRNNTGKDSTLYTILEGGLLDYPLAGEPVPVAGLTIEEIGEILTEKIKLYDNPEVSVSVRDYASHKVTVTGLVEKPGVKFLKREAVPLFAVLAEAIQQTGARRAVIQRSSSGEEVTIDLREPHDDVQLQNGDAVRVLGGEAETGGQFFFIGGFVAAPGQKSFHQGLTLTQAVLASGGETAAGKNAIVWRQNANGLLEKSEFNLKQIKNGKIPDPPVKAGDRIEIKK